MVVLAALMSVLFITGLNIARSQAGPESIPKLNFHVSRRFGVRAAASLGCGSLVVVGSGWLLPGVVVGVGTWLGIGGWNGRHGSATREIALLADLASWIENVRDVLIAGEQPIGAITSTVAACSPSLRPHVRRLAAGLGRLDPDILFRRFADDLDDPLGDLVAAGLSIAIRRGARTVPVLTSLAMQTRQDVDRRRLIEAERAPARREVAVLTLIMGGLVTGLLVFGRSQYLDAYDEVDGQVFLACSLAGFVALIIRVQRLAAFARPSRFLTSGGGSL